MRGSIQVRELKKKPGAKKAEKRYDAVWRAAGKQSRKTFTRRRDATKHLAELAMDHQLNTALENKNISEIVF